MFRIRWDQAIQLRGSTSASITARATLPSSLHVNRSFHGQTRSCLFSFFFASGLEKFYLDTENESFGFIHCHLIIFSRNFEQSIHRKLTQPFDCQEAKKRKLSPKSTLGKEKRVSEKKNKERRENGSGCTLSFDIPCFGRLNEIDLVCGSVFKHPTRFNHLFSFFFYLHVSFMTIPTL